MNKELCNALKTRLASAPALPFAEVLAGMVQTVTYTDYDETNSTNVVKRMPVSYDTNIAGVDCTGQEQSLVPNSNRKSMIYFEDFGIAFGGRAHGMAQFASSIRLICWMNRARLTNSIYQEISGPAMAAVIDKIGAGQNPANIGIFTRLTVEIVKIPPQDPALFSRYTYNETDRQYLRPPFEFFGIDLLCKYAVSSKCIDGISWGGETCY